MAVAMTGSGRS